MSDLCSMSVRVRADQIELFCKASELCEPEFFEIDDSIGIGTAEFEEVEYGGYSDLLEATQAGVVFVGSHGGGYEYGPARFAAINKYYCEHDVNHSGELVVAANADGNVYVARHAELKRFCTHYKNAQVALAAKNPPKPKRKRVKS